MDKILVICEETERLLDDMMTALAEVHDQLAITDRQLVTTIDQLGGLEFELHERTHPRE